jgi:O-methyltransferase
MEETIEICQKYSMLSRERLENNIESIKYIQDNNINGAVVEIGVWKGGSMLSMLLTYEKYNETQRDFYLYDTFSGMTAPLNIDEDCNGNKADDAMKTSISIKAEAPYQEVHDNIFRHSTYDKSKISFHVGDILKNKTYPEKIALLRLDTDWYESTKFELDNFYKYVESGGVVIIDDYGHWKGCKRAVNEFLENNPDIDLIPVDYTGVYFIKP